MDIKIFHYDNFSFAIFQAICIIWKLQNFLLDEIHFILFFYKSWSNCLILNRHNFQTSVLKWIFFQTWQMENFQTETLTFPIPNSVIFRVFSDSSCHVFWNSIWNFWQSKSTVSMNHQLKVGWNAVSLSSHAFMWLMKETNDFVSVCWANNIFAMIKSLLFDEWPHFWWHFQYWSRSTCSFIGSCGSCYRHSTI